jgi:tetratricopeptide (TPR) repeat protein
MRLDYAFIPYGDMGSSHQFGLSYHFGTRAPEEAYLKSSASSVVVSPSPVTVFVQVPVAPTATPVTPRAVEGPVGVDGGALVMDFEESSEGLSAARASVKEGRMVEAVKAYVDWLSKNPRDAQAWWELGGLYYQLGKKEYAVKCFESVLTLKPGNKNLSDWLEKNRNLP